MNDHDDRQAPFWRAYHAALRSCNLPDAHDGVSGSARVAVWRCFADHADNLTHQAYPSIDRIAMQTRLSSATVQRAIKALVSSGWLALISPQAGRRPPVYRVTILGHHGDNPNDNPNSKGYHGDNANDASNDNPNDNPNSRVIMVSPRVITEYSQGHHGDDQTNITNKELVETRAHEPARTTTPPEGRAESAPPAKPTDIDPAAMDGLILDMFDRYGRAMEIGIAGGLHHTLRDKGLTNRQVLAYLEERLIEFGVSDYDTKAAVRYIIRDAGKWLEDVTPPRRPEISQAQLDAEDAYDRQCAEDYAMIQSFTPAAKLLWDQAVQRTWERSMDGIDHPPEDLHALKLKLYAMSQESTR